MGSTVVGKYNVEAIKVKLKLFLWFIKHLEMKYGRTKVQLHALLTSARNRNVKQKPGSLQPKARGSGTPLTAGWVGPHSRFGNSAEEKTTVLLPRNESWSSSL